LLIIQLSDVMYKMFHHTECTFSFGNNNHEICTGRKYCITEKDSNFYNLYRPAIAVLACRSAISGAQMYIILRSAEVSSILPLKYVCSHICWPGTVLVFGTINIIRTVDLNFNCRTYRRRYPVCLG